MDMNYCNCQELPQAIMDTDSNLQGYDEFKKYFTLLDNNEGVTVEFTQNFYECRVCGQNWYIENAPEEFPFPIFAMKIKSIEELPRSEDIFKEKHFLTILAHRGFDSTICKNAGCNNLSLKDKWLCIEHY